MLIVMSSLCLPSQNWNTKKHRISESGGKSFGSPLLGLLSLLATGLISWEVKAVHAEGQPAGVTGVSGEEAQHMYRIHWH